MRYVVSNPYADPQTLAPAKPRPAPYPRHAPANPYETDEEKRIRVDRGVAARMRLQALMRRAANPQDYD